MKRRTEQRDSRVLWHVFRSDWESREAKGLQGSLLLHAGVRLPQLAPRAQRLEHVTTPAKEKMRDTTMSEIVLPDGTRLEGVAAQKVFILPPPFYV